MTTAPRFDISLREGGPTLDYHFCREWDDEGGCYGTKSDHGMSFEQAREEIRRWHLREAERWATLTYEQWNGADAAADCPI